jgi:hypothetical protein
MSVSISERARAIFELENSKKELMAQAEFWNQDSAKLCTALKVEQCKFNVEFEADHSIDRVVTYQETTRPILRGLLLNGKRHSAIIEAIIKIDHLIETMFNPYI